MRAHRPLPFAPAATALAAAVVVAAAVLVAGCGPARRAAADGAATAAPRDAANRAADTAAHAHGRALAPADPDLGTVTERFYQYVEGGHLQFAYAMLSPRYRATLSEDDLRRRYDGLADAEIALRHTPGTVVVAQLDAPDPNDRARRVFLEEKIRFAWDGEQWTIDDIARREVKRTAR